MDYKDYYKILGINKKATQNEIKKAFRALALQHHPDKNAGNKEAEERFKLVNEANQVLSNPEKRAKYDELGENWQQYEQSSNQKTNNQQRGNASARTSSAPFGGQQYYQGDSNNAFAGGAPSDFSDFFEQFFAGRAEGGAQGRAGKTQARNGNSRNPAIFKGGDYETEMEITLEEAYTGTHRVVQLENGKLRVTTKPGAYSDQLLRIKGKGAKGSSEEHHGDLFVRVKVLPHSHWTRTGDDLYQTCNIDVFTAVLGGETIIRTLSLAEQVKIKIAAGTQNDKTIRLKGKGMPVYGKPNVFGDVYLHVHVQIPENLTAQQRELFKTIQSTM